MDPSRTIIRVKRKAHQLPIDYLTVNWSKRARCADNESFRSFRRVDRMHRSGSFSILKSDISLLKDINRVSLSASQPDLCASQNEMLEELPQGGTDNPSTYALYDYTLPDSAPDVSAVNESEAEVQTDFYVLAKEDNAPNQDEGMCVGCDELRQDLSANVSEFSFLWAGADEVVDASELESSGSSFNADEPVLDGIL
ncbi:hypothetical protein J8273_2343 [Carpediemonas membranifera]|uniref:Uncharacterized protein n=1 Tax=Carpediemonas membranifera TaxID=201153 RepID=A0A8J6E177_9EUKA|nr:hypothetical protein J8273_2343 [Carpediemonas membranifera]|eukprot:KAG9395994.1 hypothetical protein J8273_2343 [Carpediemonas membranifera]